MSDELFEGHPLLQWIWRYFPVMLVFGFIFAGVFVSVFYGILNSIEELRGAP